MGNIVMGTVLAWLLDLLVLDSFPMLKHLVNRLQKAKQLHALQIDAIA
jgi:hypothetical protein